MSKLRSVFLDIFNAAHIFFFRSNDERVGNKSLKKKKKNTNSAFESGVWEHLKYAGQEEWSAPGRRHRTENKPPTCTSRILVEVSLSTKEKELLSWSKCHQQQNMYDDFTRTHTTQACFHPLMIRLYWLSKKLLCAPNSNSTDGWGSWRHEQLVDGGGVIGARTLWAAKCVFRDQQCNFIQNIHIPALATRWLG